MSTLDSPWRNSLEVCTVSDVGLRRTNNQDSYSVTLARDQYLWNRRGHLFIVADGMGAHAAGELASKIATDNIPASYFKKTDTPPPDALRQAIREANQQIHKRGNADKQLKGMGTTCDALVILPEGMMIGHVGDSRVYRLRGPRLEQMTFDHSVVWEMEASGVKPDASVRKNVITRCLGVNASVEVDIEGPWDVAKGDIFLLCSDGLSGQFDDAEIGKVLSALPLPQATQALVDLANLRGGPDNITVTTVKFLGPQKQAFPPGQEEKTEIIAPRTIIDRPKTPLWAWSMLGILGLATLILCIFCLSNFRTIFTFGIPALVTLVLTLGMWGLIRNMRQPPPAFASRRLGRAPYRVYNAVCDADFVKTLQDIFHELRESVAERDNMDFQQVDILAESGNQAMAGKQYKEACREYCLAISAVWGQLV